LRKSARLNSTNVFGSKFHSIDAKAIFGLCLFRNARGTPYVVGKPANPSRLAAGFFGFLMGFLGRLKSFCRVFHRLPGMFPARQMILFAVMRGGRAMSVRRHFVELSRSLVGIPCHNISFQEKSFVVAAQEYKNSILAAGSVQPGI
jgi:hypothetical protein